MALSHSLHNLLHNTLNNLSVSKAVSVCVFFSFIFFFFFPSHSCSKDCGRCLGVCVLKTTANRGKVLCGFPSLGMQKKKKQKLCEPAAPTHPPQFFPQLLLTGVWVCGSPPFRYHDKTTTTMSLVCFVSSKASAPKNIDVQQAVFKKCVQIGSPLVVGMAQSHCCHY